MFNDYQDTLWQKNSFLEKRLKKPTKTMFSFRFVYDSKLTSLNLYTSITGDIHTKPKTLKKIIFRIKVFQNII